MPEPTDAQLAEWLELAEKATPADRLTITRYRHGGGRVIEGPERTVPTWKPTDGTRDLVADFYDAGNREFYYSARTGWPATIRALQAARERMRLLEADAQILSDQRQQALAQVQKQTAEIVSIENAITEVLGNGDWESAPREIILALGAELKMARERIKALEAAQLAAVAGSSLKVVNV